MDAPAMYLEARSAFGATVSAAELVSMGAGGVASETARHYWASVLFTRLVVTAKSVQALTPKVGPETHVDFSAVASIVRDLAECYLFAFFLCFDEIRELVEKPGDARIVDLHVWRVGPEARAAIVAVAGISAETVRERLNTVLEVDHLTVEAR